MIINDLNLNRISPVSECGDIQKQTTKEKFTNAESFESLLKMAMDDSAEKKLQEKREAAEKAEKEALAKTNVSSNAALIAASVVAIEALKKEEEKTSSNKNNYIYKQAEKAYGM